MSFICQACKESQRPSGQVKTFEERETWWRKNEDKGGPRPEKVVREYRSKMYPPRMRRHRLIDKGGEGYEIVSESNLCKDCATLAWYVGNKIEDIKRLA